ncbi:NAD(P)-dependent alcohol dehydrogenase [Streptosporangium sp. NPDC000396]|uniref:NAD(P)-dependent alcohol dehydrogenase n=1 Tax=Streptosporangium sp. NPDC000396 TaxID=3366185 RepID=UPI00368BC572
MKAIVYKEYGSAEVLRYTDVDKPAVGDDQVLVRVRAASINYADRAIMHGSPSIMRLAFGLRRPKETILGRDIAGTVEAVGAKVTRFRVGDEVFGEMNQRGFAEYVAAPETHLAPKPAGVTFEQAATLPVAATTALRALRLGEVGPGRTVLVNGASGGVGTFTVQLANALGAKVTGVCSTRNAELVRSIGAHHVIDYTREDLIPGTGRDTGRDVTRGTGRDVTRDTDRDTTQGAGHDVSRDAGRDAGRFDVIVDLAGNYRISEFRRLLTPKGVYISSSGTGGPMLGPLPRLLAAAVISPFVSQKLRGLYVKRSTEDLTHLAELVATGKITPVIQQTYPLGETAAAIHSLETEHARGKVVLTL